MYYNARISSAGSKIKNKIYLEALNKVSKHKSETELHQENRKHKSETELHQENRKQNPRDTSLERISHREREKNRRRQSLCAVLEAIDIHDTIQGDDLLRFNRTRRKSLAVQLPMMDEKGTDLNESPKEEVQGRESRSVKNGMQDKEGSALHSTLRTDDQATNKKPAKKSNKTSFEQLTDEQAAERGPEIEKPNKEYESKPKKAGRKSSFDKIKSELKIKIKGVRKKISLDDEEMLKNKGDDEEENEEHQKKWNFLKNRRRSEGSALKCATSLNDDRRTSEPFHFEPISGFLRPSSGPGSSDPFLGTSSSSENMNSILDSYNIDRNISPNILNAPDDSTVQCFCGDISCPFCNLLINLELNYNK